MDAEGPEAPQALMSKLMANMLINSGNKREIFIVGHLQKQQKSL
jgi:hypothetical protein